MTAPDLHKQCGGGVIETLERGNSVVGRFPIARICLSCGETWSMLRTYRVLRREYEGSIVAPFGSESRLEQPR